MLKHSLIALAAMGAGLLGLSTGASAFTTYADFGGGPGLMVDVNHHHHHNWDNHWRDRCDGWSDRCRYRHGGFFYDSPWWMFPGVGIGIGSGYYGGDYYDRGYYRGGYGSRHVRWCLDRYRSYNPRTNTWVSYSGRVYQCISPYDR